jgi:predicted MFS family arabinose efflux permease
LVKIAVRFMSASPLNPARERWLLLILAGIQFTHIMDFMVLTPLGPQFMRLFSISAQEFSLLVSSYMLTAAIVGLFSAFYIDRFDRRTALLWMYGGFGVATLLCALAPNFHVLLITRAIAGAFGGVLGAIVFSIVSDVIPEARRGAAMGLVMSAFGAASVIGVPSGLTVAAIWSWRASFYLLTVLNIAILFGAWRLLPPIIAHLQHVNRPGILEQGKLIFGNQNHLRGFLLVAIMVFGSMSVIPFISAYLVKNVGIKESQLAYVYLSGGFATLFTGRWIGRLSDRYGTTKIFAIVALLSIIPLMVITHLPVGTPIWFCVFNGTIFFILISGRGVPMNALISTIVAPSLRGSYMSFSNSIQQLSIAAAALVGGAIIGQTHSGTLAHYGAVGWVAAGATLVAIWLAQRLTKYSPATN